MEMNFLTASVYLSVSMTVCLSGSRSVELSLYIFGLSICIYPMYLLLFLRLLNPHNPSVTYPHNSSVTYPENSSALKTERTFVPLFELLQCCICVFARAQVGYQRCQSHVDVDKLRTNHSSPSFSLTHPNALNMSQLIAS